MNSTNHQQDIDFVITWVDGNDPAWKTQKMHYLSELSDRDTIAKQGDYRFRDWELLHYWFRAVEKYAPWVRKIHFVTCGQIPEWMNVEHPKLHLVQHSDYIPMEYLPTFNSHTIEVNFHRIEGLAEQFVYFNDDTFLTREVTPEDFFISGLPKDVFALDSIFCKTESSGCYICNDMEIINDYFIKAEQFKKHWKKWFHLSYGLKQLYRTIVLSPWKWFPGFYYQHLSGNFLKSTYEKVWNIAGEVLHETSKNKFRAKNQVNQWLFKYWQLAEGQFMPSSSSFGHCYHLENSDVTNICMAIKNKRYGVICINDTNLTTDFEGKKARISEAFYSVLPCKSSFEK